jgi:inorganic pyrophosphatase
MTLITIPVIFLLPDQIHFFNVFGDNTITCTQWKAFTCVCLGLWSGLIIGYVTEIYTSNAYSPVQNLAEACCMGAAPNIILGLALGYFSCIIPVFCIAITIYVSFIFGGMYGVALSALGMLGCLPIALAIDGYGPISDNAGGIAEMCNL